MSASRSSRSRRTRSADPTSTLPTPETETTKSAPYDGNFDLHLTDHRAYATYSSQKPDLADVRKALAVSRRSLSSPMFSDGAFEMFQESDARAKDKDDVLVNVIPTIFGPGQTSHAYASARNTVFGNLEPLTDGTIAPAKPDIYYGAHPEKLSESVRNELGHHIIPSTMEDKPLAPNFFLEAKGPNGSTAVATRQARYDGAIGSRAIHSLQNYSQKEPVFDGNAYTFSSTYHNSCLKLFAHHPTAPTTEGDRPEYHMTQVGAYAMTDGRDEFVRGATALRNARDLAKRHLDNFIQAANTKASQAETVTGQEVPIQTSKDDPNFHESTDHADYPLSQNADAALQQHIPEAGNYGVTSSFSTDPSRSKRKRKRQSLSPPSNYKSRTRPSTTRRTTESSTSATESAQSGSSKARRPASTE